MKFTTNSELSITRSTRGNHMFRISLFKITTILVGGWLFTLSYPSYASEDIQSDPHPEVNIVCYHDKEAYAAIEAGYFRQKSGHTYALRYSQEALYLDLTDLDTSRSIGSFRTGLTICDVPNLPQ